MSVSLDDAWGSTENFLTDEIRHNPSISAQQSVVKDAKEVSLDRDTKSEVSSVKSDEKTEILMLLLDEIRIMRQEQTRKFIVLLIVTGIIAAFLFMYIDRLQSKVHRMNQAVHRLYWQRSLRKSQGELFDEVLSQNL